MQGDAVLNVCIIEMIIREQVKLERLSEVIRFRLDQGFICPGYPGLCQVAFNNCKDGESIPCLGSLFLYLTSLTK